MRNLKEQLADFGISNIIDYCKLVLTQDKWIVYPCFYPPIINDSRQIEVNAVRRGRIAPDFYNSLSEEQKKEQGRFFNPNADECVNGEMPLFYTPNYDDLRTNIINASGTLNLFEGDKDTWTAFSFGWMNSIGLISAGNKLDARFVFQMRDLGVNNIRFYCDSDHAGWNVAERLIDICNEYGLRITVYHLPFSFNGQSVKDLNDLWCACEFSSGITKILQNLKPVKLVDKPHRDHAKDDIFTQDLFDEIETKANFQFHGNKEWSEATACLFNSHQHDDTKPAFSWNRKQHRARCFKCGESFLAKDVAVQLGIDYRKYIRKDLDVYGIDEKIVTLTPSVEAKESSLQSANNLSHGVKAKTSFSDTPSDQFLYSLDDALDDAEKRILGLGVSRFPPIVNPFTSMHFLGGAAHVFVPPLMVGVLGRSSGFKSSSFFTLVDLLSSQGYHGIVFTPEWTKQKNANRVLQQFGGLKMFETSLLERWHYEQSALNSGFLQPDDNSLFGIKPSDDEIHKNLLLLQQIKSRLRGKVVYIDTFGQDVLKILEMLVEAVQRMTDAGHAPSYFVFDYVQLALPPRHLRDWTVQETITETKRVTNDLGLVTFMASQVRKLDTEGLRDGDMLSGTSGLNFHDHQFNLFWTINPIDVELKIPVGDFTDEEIYAGIFSPDAEYRRYREIKFAVTKNSDGMTTDNVAGQSISLFVDLDRLVVVEDPYRPNPLFNVSLDSELLLT